MLCVPVSHANYSPEKKALAEGITLKQKSKENFVKLKLRNEKENKCKKTYKTLCLLFM